MIVELARRSPRRRRATIRSTVGRGSMPSSPLASAAAFLRMPSARIIGRGKCSRADAEVMQRPLGLRAPVAIRRNGDLAHAVGFRARLPLAWTIGHDTEKVSENRGYRRSMIGNRRSKIIDESVHRYRSIDDRDASHHRTSREPRASDHADRRSSMLCDDRCIDIDGSLIDGFRSTIPDCRSAMTISRLAGLESFLFLPRA